MTGLGRMARYEHVEKGSEVRRTKMTAGAARAVQPDDLRGCVDEVVRRTTGCTNSIESKKGWSALKRFTRHFGSSAG
jgi:hypothetical protein